MSANQRNIGHFELQECLARDAISEVWKAFDAQTRRYVVIKILHVSAQNAQISPDILQRFLNEAHNLPSLHHPNIASVLDVQISQGPDTIISTAAIIMEYIEGQSLAEYIQRTSRAGKFPPPQEIIRILAPVAAAIDYAHQQGIIHGAIRPSSILLEKRDASQQAPGEPKLVGFGTNTLQMPLTLPLKDVYYISPERAQGHTENARSDIYSLGVVLYEMCTGTYPFEGETPMEVMMQHIHASPTSPALINPHIIPALTAVILRSLAKDPAARHPSATALLVAASKALSIPTQEILSQSGSLMGMAINVALLKSGTQDPMNSPTYISSPPQYKSISGVWPAITNQQTIIQTPPTNSPTPLPPANTGGMPTVVPPQWSQPYPAIAPGPISNAGIPPQVQPPPLPQAPPPIPAVAPPPIFKRHRGWFIAISAILLAIIIGSGIGIIYVNQRQQYAAAPPVVGHIYFVSSGELNQNTTNGIADRLQVALNNIPNLQSGKSYYLWLLSDTDAQSTTFPPIPLGSSPHGGLINLYYGGNAAHTNLLANYSRILVTEEDTNSPPLNPSPDTATWKYEASFSQVKQGNPAYSLLDHLRHMLAQDPKLKTAGLTGGLDMWLFHNTLKILEEAGSIRDSDNINSVPFIQRQLIRMLDYLDGSQYVQTEKLPPNLPPIMIDPNQAHVALLEFDPQSQVPPGYMKHIGDHLREIVVASGVTPGQKAQAIRINAALNNVQGWLENVHNDAAQLIQMTPQQLVAPGTSRLLNDMFTQANYAFVGQTDPNTGKVKEGVVQIHYNVLGLATFDVHPYTTP
jgi:serine/threonine protein kinase